MTTNMESSSMEHVLMRVRTTGNLDLDDDKFVESVMNKLMIDYPAVHGYIYERIGPEHLQILMWGDIEVVT